MRISNYTETGLDRINRWLVANDINDLSLSDFRQAFATSSVSLVAEGISRVQSTLLCELKDSYVQQSQRYVTTGMDGFLLPDLEEADAGEAKALIREAYELYRQMSVLVPGDHKGRPKLEHYQHGIPIEDARYILPLASRTNLCISMAGDKLYDLYKLIYNPVYAGVFTDLQAMLSLIMPERIEGLILNILAREGRETGLIYKNYSKDGGLIEKTNNEGSEGSQTLGSPDDLSNIETSSDYSHSQGRLQALIDGKIDGLYDWAYDQLSADEPLIFLEAFDNLDLRVGLGALTSTQAKSSSEILEAWGDEAQAKAQAVTDRVLGYGHSSIAEQARTSFAMMMSLACYHQQIRHRLPEMRRESLAKIIQDSNRDLVLPETIAASEFKEAYLELADRYKAFSQKILAKYGLGAALSFLLNCDQVKLVMTTNARMDAMMLSDRTCLNAQWEIRKLSTAKLAILRQMSEVLYEKGAPSCAWGRCKEGKLSCGKMVEVREYFKRKE